MKHKPLKTIPPHVKQQLLAVLPARFAPYIATDVIECIHKSNILSLSNYWSRIFGGTFLHESGLKKLERLAQSPELDKYFLDENGVIFSIKADNTTNFPMRTYIEDEMVHVLDGQSETVLYKAQLFNSLTSLASHFEDVE
tara:strand:- start:29 stop:448 length:420 start_codon:yes stop_codon:yes gene_type:complete